MLTRRALLKAVAAGIPAVAAGALLSTLPEAVTASPPPEIAKPLPARNIGAEVSLHRVWTSGDPVQLVSHNHYLSPTDGSHTHTIELGPFNPVPPHLHDATMSSMNDMAFFPVVGPEGKYPVMSFDLNGTAFGAESISDFLEKALAIEGELTLPATKEAPPPSFVARQGDDNFFAFVSDETARRDSRHAYFELRRAFADRLAT